MTHSSVAHCTFKNIAFKIALFGEAGSHTCFNIFFLYLCLSFPLPRFFSTRQSEKMRSETTYLMSVARCYIMTGAPKNAWELFLRMKTSTESFQLLQMIANDCYKCVLFPRSLAERENEIQAVPRLKFRSRGRERNTTIPCIRSCSFCLLAHRVGQFFYAAKAFDILERLDANPEYWEGKRGASAGVLQMYLVGRASRDQLGEVVGMLQDSAEKQPQGPQAESIANIITGFIGGGEDD